MWLNPAIISTFLSTLILSFVFLYLYATLRESYIRTWTIGWMLYSMRFAFSLMYINGFSYPLIMIAGQYATLGGGVLLFMGTYEYLDERVHKVYYYVIALIFAWIPVAVFGGYSFFALTFPVFIFLAYIYIKAGLALIGSGHTGGRASLFAGLVLILWGLHKADFPFLYEIKWFAPFGFMLASIFTILTAIGMILIYFERHRAMLLQEIEVRKETEAELKHSKDFTEKIIETSSIMLVGLGPNGEILIFNDAAESVTGYLRAEVIGRNWFDMFLPEYTAPEVRDVFNKAVYEKNIPQTYKNPITVKSGDKRMILWQNSLLFESYMPVRVISFGVDITDQERIEEALIRAGQIIEQSRYAVISSDLEGNITSCNQGAEQMLGYSRAELIGKSVLTLYAENDRPLRAEISNKLFEKGNVETEIRFVKKTGELIYVDLTLWLLRDAQGEVVGMVGHSIDITEHRRIRREVEEKNKRISDTLDSISDAFFALDDNMIVTYFNKAAENMLNKSASDVMGRDLFDAFPEARGSVFDEKYSQAIREKIPLSFEIFFDVPPYVNWYEVRVYPQINGISVYFRITTEQKKAEETIMASLREKEVMLREIHHRVKNNMQIISSLVYLQRRQTHSSEAAHVLSDIGLRIQAMALAHEKLYQSGNFANIEINEYLVSLMKNIFSALGSAGIEFTHEIENVKIDFDTIIPLGIIINELATNALKYAFVDRDGGEIHLSLKSDGDMATLVFSDNGVGISREIDLSDIKSMGLQIVEALSAQIGGSLSLRRDGGTSFSITFPWGD